MFGLRRCAAAAVALSVFAAAEAKALPVVAYQVQLVDLDNFVSFLDAPGPAQGPVSGTFTFFEDLTVDTFGLVPDQASFSLEFDTGGGGTRLADYDTSNVLIDIDADFGGNAGVTAIIIDGLTNEGVTTSGDFFNISIALNASTLEFVTAPQFAYIPGNETTNYFPGTGTLNFAVQRVPVPAALPLLAGAMAGLALIGRKRKSA